MQIRLTHSNTLLAILIGISACTPTVQGTRSLSQTNDPADALATVTARGEEAGPLGTVVPRVDDVGNPSGFPGWSTLATRAAGIDLEEPGTVGGINDAEEANKWVTLPVVTHTADTRPLRTVTPRVGDGSGDTRGPNWYILTARTAGPVALVIIYALLKRFSRTPLSVIRGPRSPSFVIGNLLELYQRPAGEADFAWQNQYGNVVRFKSVLGEDRLLIADPKALQKILNTSGYSYPKLHNIRAISRMLHGKGINWADGEVHKRQRSIMLPGFGHNECKVFLPIFKNSAEAISMKWSESIASNDDQPMVINVLDWLSRGTLDVIGRAAFDIEFGTLQDNLHPLAKGYKNYFNDIFGLPSATQIFIQAASKYVPMGILQWMADNGSSPRLARARNMKATTTRVVEGLVREKAEALLQGKGSRDILTLLIKANMDATAKKRLSDEELYASMRTLLFAGHETTATTLSWALLELARNPDVQSRLRDEIRKTEAVMYARGDSHLTVMDLESMPYMNAVIKEVLRLHPAESNTLRIAGQDDFLPLSKPVLTKSGDLINEVLVPKGTEIVVSISAYNRDKDIWGEDAHEFKPDRWLDGAMDKKKLPSIGVYSNLLTFLSGTRGCIGWRFAVVGLQAFLSTLVDKFEFGMTSKAERIVRQTVLLMVPLVDGELERGVQMPLAVSLAPQDNDI